MRLLRTLSIVSRRRWPKDADPAPTVGVPPPKKKAAAPPPPSADDGARATASPCSTRRVPRGQTLPT